MKDPDGTILALDIGASRIGMALANYIARIASPYGTLQNDSSGLDRLRVICDSQDVKQLVIGLPRGLDGQETAQTMTVRAFGATLAKALDLPVAWQDEALTSVQAEVELRKRGRAYRKEDIDALAAVYILEDYLGENV